MTTAFVRHDPPGVLLPLVLDSPHSGEWYPDDFDHAPPRSMVRQAEDTHVARLWQHAVAHGATLLEARFPRAYIDANRSVDDIDLALLEDGWPVPVTPSRKSEQGIGLVWRLARGGVPMYARKLTAAEVQGRIDLCWRPYHAELEALLQARRRAYGGVWHINCHSMPAVGDALSDDPGHERADFVLGDRDGSTCDAAFTQCVADAARGMGYTVAVNDPYKGVELVRRHGRPADNRHSLQIELKRTLYMDEVSLEPHAGYRRRERDLAELTRTLAAFVGERIPVTFP